MLPSCCIFEKEEAVNCSTNAILHPQHCHSSPADMYLANSWSKRSLLCTESLFVAGLMKNNKGAWEEQIPSSRAHQVMVHTLSQLWGKAQKHGTSENMHQNLLHWVHGLFLVVKSTLKSSPSLVNAEKAGRHVSNSVSDIPLPCQPGHFSVWSFAGGVNEGIQRTVLFQRRSWCPEEQKSCSNSRF